MPAAAKMMADNQPAGRLGAGTGKDGRVTKGDVLGALRRPAPRRLRRRAARRPPRRRRRAEAALPPVAAPPRADRSATAPSSACR